MTQTNLSTQQLQQQADVQKKHSEMVEKLHKPGETIRQELTASDCHLMHMAMGCAGEAGELIDAVKKHTMYRKLLDVQNIVEELGDLEFYMEGLRMELGITRDECLIHNMNKLGTRYKDFEYSDQRAIERKDKA